jgi:hypothetical protein
MQAAKRQRVRGVPEWPYTILNDPIRTRWLILYFALGLECDTPILELLWCEISKELLVLTKPLKILNDVEAILCPVFQRVDNVETGCLPTFLCRKPYDISFRWICTYQTHEKPLPTKPFFTLTFSSGYCTEIPHAHGHFTRTGAFQIDDSGFNFYTFEASFKKWRRSFESYETLLQHLKSFNNVAAKSFSRVEEVKTALLSCWTGVSRCW